MDKVDNSLLRSTTRALDRTMDPNVMVAMARKLIPRYDLHDRTGYPRNAPIPSLEAARQIVTDISEADLFPDFVLLLLEAENKGYRGKRYVIPNMREILRSIYNMGFLYEPENKIFMENPDLSRTRNWGGLREGETYILAFLRIDIVGNSKIVRNNDPAEVNAAYEDFREMFDQTVNRRNGRIWGWDGDGGLGAFFVGNRNQSAVLAGIELIHEIFLYNRSLCPLKEPLSIRGAVHSGSFEYTTSEEEMKSNETIKKAIRIESKHTKPGTLTISPVAKLMLDHLVAVEFTPFTGKDGQEYFNYALKLESS